MNYTTITLGELLGSQNEIIKRNAMSILKTLQKLQYDEEQEELLEKELSTQDYKQRTEHKNY